MRKYGFRHPGTPLEYQYRGARPGTTGVGRQVGRQVLAIAVNEEKHRKRLRFRSNIYIAVLLIIFFYISFCAFYSTTIVAYVPI